MMHLKLNIGSYGHDETAAMIYFVYRCMKWLLFVPQLVPEIMNALI